MVDEPLLQHGEHVEHQLRHLLGRVEPVRRPDEALLELLDQLAEPERLDGVPACSPDLIDEEAVRAVRARLHGPFGHLVAAPGGGRAGHRGIGEDVRPGDERLLVGGAFQHLSQLLVKGPGVAVVVAVAEVRRPQLLPQFGFSRVCGRRAVPEEQVAELIGEFSDGLRGKRGKELGTGEFGPQLALESEEGASQFQPCSLVRQPLVRIRTADRLGREVRGAVVSLLVLLGAGHETPLV